MASPISDRLKDWQADASGADSNQPTNSTNMGDGQAGDLDAELRLLKSEIRALSIIMSWERWLGLKNLAASGNIAFTYVDATHFTVNDNFTSASRLVAVVGRRVKAFVTAGTIYGTITAASFSSTTSVTVAWDSGALDSGLTEVQFGPEIRSLPFFNGASSGNFLRYNGTVWLPTALAFGDVPSIATAAQYRANTANKILTTDQVWSAAGLVNLTDAATIAVDMSLGFNFAVTLGGNRTLGNPTNGKPGQQGVFIIAQDGTGSRTLALASNYKKAAGSNFTLTTTASATDVIGYFVLDPSIIILTGILKGVS